MSCVLFIMVPFPFCLWVCSINHKACRAYHIINIRHIWTIVNHDQRSHQQPPVYTLPVSIVGDTHCILSYKYTNYSLCKHQTHVSDNTTRANASFGQNHLNYTKFLLGNSTIVQAKQADWHHNHCAYDVCYSQLLLWNGYCVIEWNSRVMTVKLNTLSLLVPVYSLMTGRCDYAGGGWLWFDQWHLIKRCDYVVLSYQLFGTIMKWKEENIIMLK